MWSQPLDPGEECEAGSEEDEDERDGEDVHASTLRAPCEDARKDPGERLKCV
jgi:hypothetical protein